MDVKICNLGTAHREAAFNLASETFAQGSTLHRALGVSLNEYREYLWPSFLTMVEEGLSIVAIDTDTEQVVGCLILSDFQPHVISNEIAPGRLAALSVLTQHLCREYNNHRTIIPGEAVLVDMGAVSSLAAGQGVYQKLRNAAQNNAKNLGYRFVIGELSSASTQHVVLNKLGHRKVAEVFFSSFEFDGSRPFAGINEPESIILAEGML